MSNETTRHRVAELERRERELESAERSVENRKNRDRRLARRASTSPRAAPRDEQDERNTALAAYNYEARRDQVLRIFSRELRTIRARYDDEANRAEGRLRSRDAARGANELAKHSEVKELAKARAAREAALLARVVQTDLSWADVEDALEGQIYAHASRDALPPRAAGVGGEATTPFWKRDPREDLARLARVAEERAQSTT